MSGSMRAQFQLDLLDGMSAPVERIERVLTGLQETLDRVGRASNPFEEIQEPIPRATRSVEEFNATMQAAFEGIHAAEDATRSLTGTLGGMGEAAVEAGAEVETIGERAERGATRAISAMERLRGIVSSVGASTGGFFGGEGRGGRVMGAGRRFGDAVQTGVGHAFAAAMEGFGIIAPIHAAAEYGNTLTHIGIGLGIDDPAANARFVNQQSMTIDALARRTGGRGSDLAEAMGFFSREGYSGARLAANMPVVAQISTAYNAAPDAVARTAFSLQESMGISDRQLGGALASIALAGKSADLPFETIAPLLPQLQAQAGVFGIHGRSGVDDLAAATAVVRKSTGTDAHAIDDMRFLISDLNQGHTANRFKRYGVNMWGIEQAARNRGDDPLMAMMKVVDRISNHGNNAAVLGDLFRNTQSFTAAAVLLRHFDQYLQIHSRTSGADQSVINRDYNAGRHSTLVELQSFEETLAQLERRVGQGFVPVLKVATAGLDRFLDAWDRFDQAFPKATPTILATIGGLVAFLAIITAIGAIAGPLVAGLGLIVAVFGAIVSPVGLAVVAVAALGAGIYELVTHVNEVGNAIVHMIGAITHAIPSALRSTGNYIADVWHDPTGTRNIMHHTAPLGPISSQTPPMVLRIEHDENTRVTTTPHPTVRMETHSTGRGRTVGRP